MARASRILAIDLGSSSVKIGEFQFDSNGGLALLNYGVQDMGLDPNKNEEKLPFYLETIRNLLTQTGIRPAPVILGISGQAVFTRFVKLPPVAPEQLQLTIANEAQLNVPFQIDEVVWDYQLLGSAGSVEIEGIIVAIKSELVEESNAILSSLKLPVQMVDVSPLALINSFLYNYGTPGESTLIVDVGAKTTNLIFIDGRRVFNRVIPIAGNMISQNICNEFQEPYVASELLKKGKGFVGLGGAYADPDDAAAARISKIARGVFTRLHSEISRSISFYRNQQGGNPPQRVYLTGGGSAMPYCDLFFKDKLSLPVEYMNPLLNLGIAPQIEKGKLAQNAQYLGPLVGMALRQLKNCPIEVNLTPPSVREQAKKSARIPYLVGAVVTALIAAGIPTLSQKLQLDKVNATLEARNLDYKHSDALNKDIKKYSDEFKKSKDLIDALARLQSQRNFWPLLLQDLNDRVPDPIWITSLIPTQTGGKELILQNAEKPTPTNVPAGKNAPAVTYNLAKQIQELQIKGIVEIQRTGPATPDQVIELGRVALKQVENFRDSLSKSPYFDSVEVKDLDLPTAQSIGLTFKILAKMKPDKTPDTMP